MAAHAASAAPAGGEATDLFARCAASPDVRDYRLARRIGVAPVFRVTESPPGPTAMIDDRESVMLGSNNYLGLAADQRVLAAAVDALGQYGSGCTGSRLMNGTVPIHLALEEELADWIGGPACLVTTTGYSANLTAIAGLTGSGDTVFVDAHSHASIIDAARLSGATLRSFRHNSTASLVQHLTRWRSDTTSGGALAVIESLYSMLGDVGPVAAASHACAAHGARLVVDEAHALGVLGPQGAGAAAAEGVRPDVVVGTFSKSLASCGGFVVASRDVIDYLRITARPFLFTAAGVPAATAAALAACRIARAEDWRREAVQARAGELRRGLAELGYAVDATSTAPIVPVVVGDRWETVRAWHALYEAGVYTNCVVGSAVPSGKALLRLSVIATHTERHIAQALNAFEELRSTSA